MEGTTSPLNPEREPSANGIGEAPYRQVSLASSGSRQWKPFAFVPRELGAALALVIVVDLVLWKGSDFGTGGFGLALLFAAAPIALFFGARIRRRTVRLAAIAAMLALVAIRSAIAPTVLTLLAGLALIFAFAFALRAKHAFVPETIVASLVSIATLPTRALGAWAGARAVRERSRVARISFLPIVVPVALCALFVGVFALANPIVARWLGIAWDALLGMGLPSFGRVITWLLALLAAVALVRPACQLATRSDAAQASGEASASSLLIARNALIGLNAVFVAYHVLDAAYLWSGRPPSGMTTQHYAHQGAFWLTVALVLLTGVVGVLFRGPLAHEPRAKLARALAYAWMAQGLLLALGTYRRIAIHVANSGLSNLRIVGILGTTLVVIGLIVVARKLHAHRSFTWLLRRQLDAFALVFVLYAVTPTHWISARLNVSRIESGAYGPLLHVQAQAHEVESAAVFVPLLHHRDWRVRQGIAVHLDMERASLAAERSERGSWRERDLLFDRTRAALERARPAIDRSRVDASLATSTLEQLALDASVDRPRRAAR